MKSSLAKGQTDEIKKQQKRMPQVTHRLEQIEKVLDKLYEDSALGSIEPDRYEQLSQKYSGEYYQLKKGIGRNQSPSIRLRKYQPKGKKVYPSGRGLQQF